MPKKQKQKKKKAGGADAKARAKKAKKIVIDKTFGMKNKNKSKKVQRFIQQQHQQAATAGMTRGEIRRQQEQEKARKRAREEKKRLQEFRAQTIVVGSGRAGPTKLPPGADPKSVYCAFHARGACRKGKKCKFSHDPNVGRKKVKMNLHEDPRDAQSMDDTWDLDKLTSVVNSKKRNRGPTASKLVCKFFLDAIETRKYGVFWECQNGPDCHYRHALPPGFQLKEDAPEQEEVKQKLISEKIEEERAKLVISQCTPMTLELFLQWKAKRKEKEAREVEEKQVAKKSKRKFNQMSGRSLFTFNPDLIDQDGDGAASADEYEVEIGSDEEAFDHDAKNWGAVGSGDTAINSLAEMQESNETTAVEQTTSTEDNETKTDAAETTTTADGVAGGDAAAAVPVDASLFMDDDDDLPSDDDSDDDDDDA